jgi:hypothetical protein
MADFLQRTPARHRYVDAYDCMISDIERISRVFGRVTLMTSQLRVLGSSMALRF